MLRGLTLTSSAPRLSCLKRISTRSFGSHNLNVCHRVVNTNNNSFFLNRRLPQRRRPIAASFSTPLSFHAKQSFTAEAKITEPQVEKLYQEENEDKAVSNWLFICAALVFGMVVVGGVTRLTESGLSMTDWKPLVGIVPPLTQEEWEAEFERYKQFPEYKKQNYNMTVDEFKNIFFWEWLHRAYGRGLGVAFAVPFVYFLARGRIPKKEALKLTGIFSLGGLQGLIGWWMVKSGLQQNDNDKSVARVSHLRLATHLGSAFTIYCLLFWQAMNWRRRKRVDILAKDIKLVRMFTHTSVGLTFMTAMAGALVAGLDAGLIYNEYPLMGGRIFPSDGLSMSPKWRNFVHNDAAVQFQHRTLALTTVASTLATFFLARRGGAQSVWRAAPRRVRMALAAMALGVVAQASIGITTLLLFVPIPLAAAHQAGSLGVLTFGMWAMHGLRRVRRI